MKIYDIYIAGSVKVNTVKATCISKACKAFIETLYKEAEYELHGKEYASIRYKDNYSVCSDYVVRLR